MQQQQMGQLEEELKESQAQLSVTEKERDRALDELKEMKMLALEANMRLSEALSTTKVEEIKMELNSVQDSLSIASQELEIKEKNIVSLKIELAKAKGLEKKLAQRDASLARLKMELNNLTRSEASARALLPESRKRIQELEAEVEKEKDSDRKTFDSLVAQTKQLEQTKILLEESKLEIASLRESLKILEGSSGQSVPNSQSCMDDDLAMQTTLESLGHGQESEKTASFKGKGTTLMKEMDLLKNELKLATEAEENGKKAMDDLALALKEVAAEANQIKEKLGVTQAELEYTKEEAGNLKMMLKSKEEKYQLLLGETRKEADRYRNNAERLRLEAEDSLLAWNGKETGFVDCIKRAEEERFAAQEESRRLLQLLTAAENKAMASKEETQKLRDILKQALNEANVAKEGAGIARDENSQLKDSLAEKEDALDFLTRENENLRLTHSAAFDNIKELKRMLSETLTTKEVKKEDKNTCSKEDEHKETGRKLKTQNSRDKEHYNGTVMCTAFGFSLKDLKPPSKHKDHVEGDLENDESLGGSIFDTIDHSPDSTAHNSKKPSSIFQDDEETVHLDETHFDDSDNDRNLRKKRALLRRFGDLVRRRSLQ
ncbi:hypothetical protein F2P56_022252 [Juglans regia]|uniref:Uncharacterized protein n=2 Tax=Juglans regia TaxID=51240 RepID=A0A833X4L1_JUGRE|nr:putative WEB family protein At1g65010, chloroplastic [Juglans regia]KAF5458201.1 hypothetical protein F2P56_022252 [Juglans regia]